MSTLSSRPRAKSSAHSYLRVLLIAGQTDFWYRSLGLRSGERQDISSLDGVYGAVSFRSTLEIFFSFVGSSPHSLLPALHLEAHV